MKVGMFRASSVTNYTLIPKGTVLLQSQEPQKKNAERRVQMEVDACWVRLALRKSYFHQQPNANEYFEKTSL